MIKILLVDNELQLLEITKSFLENLKKYKVDTSSSAKEAIEKIGMNKYDAIVSEYQMPEMNGIELLRWMRSQNDLTPFILNTGSGNEEVAIEALNTDANYYLKKGGDLRAQFTKLLALIEKAVQKNNPESELTLDKSTLTTSKLNLLSNITVHDIQNQIIVLNGLVYKAKHANSQVQIKEYLSRIQQVADKIQSHVAFARDYQNLGKAPPTWIRLDNGIQELASKFDSKWVQFEVDLESLEIFSDVMLNRAFYNLIDDTLKHGQKATKVKFTARASGEDLILVYEDNGVGVPMDRKKSIFEKAPSTQKMHGLVLVKEILGITGMTIVENGEPGKGARFEIVVQKGNFRYSRTDKPMLN